LDDTCWYRLVERGFKALPAELVDGRWRYATPQKVAPGAAVSEPTLRSGEALPGWVGTAPDWRAAPPPAEPARPERLAPSRPENVELGPVPPTATPLARRGTARNRFRRGTLLHALLQYLPDVPAGQREAAALAWLDRPGNELAAGEAEALAHEIMALLEHPQLAPLFGPGSRAEVPLTGVVEGVVIGGLVDRLAVLDDRVIIADYKTNRRPPAGIADTPVLYLRQMAAYRSVLRRIFPDRDVQCALVWTQASQVVMLPDDLLDLAVVPPNLNRK
jgi:ATP-dependent helicase/nuclease subunit A